MRILVTNDDGIESAGLWALARVAVEAGAETVVAAPSWDSSGASASLTAVEEDGRFLVEERSIPDLPEAKAWAVEGAPAFIVRAALTGAFGPAPDLVLSGINVGPNTGHAVLHSGTVGAALTAAVSGLPAMAVSIGMGEPARWETAALVAGEALRWLMETGREAVTLNVNVPNLAPEELSGFERATLAPFGVVQATVTETGAGYVKLNYGEVGEPLVPGSDAALLAEGKACYTPLRSVEEAADVRVDGVGGDLLVSGGGPPGARRR